MIELDGEPIGRFRVVRFEDRIFLGGIQIHPESRQRFEIDLSGIVEARQLAPT